MKGSLYVAYCGVLFPPGGGDQLLGSVTLLDTEAPKTASEVQELEEWLRDVKLPEMGRPLYSQLVLLNWKELEE